MPRTQPIDVSFFDTAPNVYEDHWDINVPAEQFWPDLVDNPLHWCHGLKIRWTCNSRVDTLDHETLTALHASLRKATRAAIRRGGVHTGEVIEHRSATGHCPRCGAPMQRATVGGRTTWFCSAEQA